MTIASLLLIVVLILFILAALGVPSSRVNLIAAGLACTVASMLVPLVG